MKKNYIGRPVSEELEFGIMREKCSTKLRKSDLKIHRTRVYYTIR